MLPIGLNPGKQACVWLFDVEVYFLDQVAKIRTCGKQRLVYLTAQLLLLLLQAMLRFHHKSSALHPDGRYPEDHC